MARAFAIGDIHGHAEQLEVLLDLLRLRPRDRLFFLGDYIDRGPDSYRVVERVRSLVDQGHVAMMGNHEWMLVEALEHNYPLMPDNGVLAMVYSYEKAFPGRGLQGLMEHHLPFYRSRPFYSTWGKFIFVHGGVEEGVPLSRQNPEKLLWKRVIGAGPHTSGKVVVCGHTPQDNRRPLDLGHTICIDTGMGYEGGRLTALDLQTLHYQQVDEDNVVYTGALSAR